MLFRSSVLFLALAFLASTIGGTTLGVNGTFFCQEKPATGALVILSKSGSFFDKSLAETSVHENGTFKLNYTDEAGYNMDLQIVIIHECDMKGMMLWDFLFGKAFVTCIPINHHRATNAGFDLDSIQLYSLKESTHHLFPFSWTYC